MLKHNANYGEGIYLYATWDRRYDRVHDCFADYAWNYLSTGDTDESQLDFLNIKPICRKENLMFC